MGYLLTVQVTNTSGTIVFDQNLDSVSNIKYETFYPGGLYGSASFLIPMDYISNSTNLRGGHGVKIFDGPRIVYEGKIDGLQPSNRGIEVECIGPWAAYFEKRGIDRRWADNRLTNEAWQELDDGTGDKFTIDRRERIRFTPRPEACVNTDQIRLQYTMPTGETIGRVEMNYDFQEGAQNWQYGVRDVVGSVWVWVVTISASGSQSVNLGTARNYVQLRYISLASQTPTSDGTYYAEIDSPMIYASRDHASATLGNVSAYQVALDILDRLAVDETLISANTSGISTALTLSVKPFITNGREAYSKILSRIAEYGDSSQNAIGYGLRRSQLSGDSKPLFFLEVYPVLTDYDFMITVEDGDVQVRENTDDVWNWISVKYRDKNGRSLIVTPDDDVNLKNADSITAYGQREKTIQLQDGAQADAINYGRRYLARHKNPTWAVTKPVRVAEISTKAGAIVPGSQIESGKRLRIVDLPDRPNAAALGVTYLITATNYDAETGICSISLGGVPDDLSVYLAQLSLG